MRQLREKAFPLAVGLLVVGAVAWALTRGTLPPADFTFINGTEVQSIDPAIVSGNPEGRIINALFEGLYRLVPKENDQGEVVKDADGNAAMVPVPAMAESCEISPDRKTYTFKIRKDADWSDGSPVTAHDFAWSWLRFLHPETPSKYASQLTYYVVGAKQYNGSLVKPGDRVEVELDDRPNDAQLFPRGTILHGIVDQVYKPAEPDLAADTSDEDREQANSRWRMKWVYAVRIMPTKDGRVEWEAPGELHFYGKKLPTEVSIDGAEVEPCKQVLVSFDDVVGIKALDDHTLQVKLLSPTPYFLELAAFYPLYPVNRACVQKYGTPLWTKAENIVCNGPYLLKFRRIRDRIRLVANPRYWAADQVSLKTIDALAVESETTNLNLYIDGDVDWATTVPNSMIPQLRKRSDFISSPMLATYFYRFNVTRKPLDNKLVRQALNLAIDKQAICEYVTKAGQLPARSWVPPGMTGYTPATCGPYDPKRARELLAEAGYPDGRGFPAIDILYNTQEAHRDIAEVIQKQWKKNLNIDARPKNLEWGVFLDTLSKIDYTVARSAWIGDYADPNTFLDMLVTNGANNETGWSNKEYDSLIAAAREEADPAKRLEILHHAEEILMDEMPIAPIYYYVSINMVKPFVKNFDPNIQDIHPLEILQVDREEKARYHEGRKP